LEKKTIKVYNKENIFDYIYSRDTAKGLVRLALTNFQGIINLGTGKSKKVSDVVSVLENHFEGLSIEYQDSKIKYESSQADTSKLFKILKWKPSDLIEKTIPEIINYEKELVKKKIRYHNVLITSISKKIPLIKAVKASVHKINSKIKIFGGDSSEEVLGKYFVDGFWKMPPIHKLEISELIKFCKKNEIGIIIPSRDGELESLSRMKNKLNKSGIYVMVSDLQSIKNCLDKLSFSLIKNIKAIPTYEDIALVKEKHLVVKGKVWSRRH